MGTDLHNTLRSLCFNTDWKYAVFWKLKHRTRMVLTWEDAYYNNCEQHDLLENKCFGETFENLCGGRYSNDPVGLAVAKMSYHVYSLGEGIVGQVAVTGKHRWIVADKHVTNSISSFETIIVVAVVPHGVVQLGSLNKVAEDMKLVNHIKDVFSSLQDSSVEQISIPLQYSMKTSLYLPDVPTQSLDSESVVIPDNLCNLDKAADKGPYNQSTMFPYLQKQSDDSYFYSLPGIHQKTAVELVNKYGGGGLSLPVNISSVKLLQPRSNISYLEQHNQVGINLVVDHTCGGKTSVWKDPGRGSELNVTPHLDNSVKDNINLCDVILPDQKFGADPANFPMDLLDSTVCDRHKSDEIDILNGALDMPESSSIDLKKHLEKKLEYQAGSSHLESSSTFLKFSAGCELHEALGPAFSKGCLYFDCEEGKTESADIIEVPEGISTSQMTFDTGSENLLDAVVGNVCYSGSTDVKREKSVCKSAQSLLTTEKMPEPSFQAKHITHSAGYSINRQSVVQNDTHNCSSSTGVRGATSSNGYSSNCPSTCSEQLDRRSEPAEKNKKRARPGENCRPRPRDRQLIQDRIKELRELVPNGAKCSIDSLLERTIKHMLFLESITKHADKLNKCAESKMYQKGTDTSNYEKGSSWAVEVGGHLKVSSIIVESLNKNGQMLVEMLCEECSHFLEIAEAIRSLGLTILKGITEVHGEKTWICFMVEGQNNKVMHRMDILWSLVQILQPKTSN
ncbi:transcription factor bHLH155 isoform X2 [Ricinus communis]|uniref:transcription factor bHLH155 isoform X2 n=1 Tax=Ricinus communis TaxID=3988 RepID=UPI00201AFBCB|nr:transcription factor bHLH155 isoform X2 [Ricinus communis]